MLKRFTAAALSAVMCVTAALSGCAEKAAAPQSTKNKDSSKPLNNDFKLQTANSLGNYIADTAHKDNNVQAQLSGEYSDVEFAVTALDLDRENGRILLVSDQPSDCRAVISFVDEETGEAAVTVGLDVKAGESVETNGSVDTAKLPEFFTVNAQLFDSMNRAVGNRFSVNRYTKQMQEILATDITAFEPERVVNFDEDETTNFLVLSDDTVKAKSSDSVNTLISADYENDTYVFGNADETIRSLEKGSDFYIQPDAENIIAIKVDSVETEGDTVTVKGENAAEEILAFAKFESVSYLSDGTVDTTDADEDVVFPDLPAGHKTYAVDPTQGINFESKNVGIENSGSASLNLSFDASKNEEDGDDNSNFSADAGFSFTGSLKITVQFNFYKTWTYTSFDMTITPELTAGVKLGGELSASEELQKLVPLVKKIKLGEVTIPTNVPGVVIKGIPKFVVKLSGSIAVTISYAPIVGFTYDSDNGLQKISHFGAEQCDATLKIEGSLFVGLELDAGVSVIDDDIAFAGFTISAGATFSIEGTVDVQGNLAANAEAKSASEKVFKFTSNQDAVHTCRACFAGGMKLGAECGLKFKVFTYEAEVTVLSLEFPMPFYDFHVSVPKGFGFGECGNNKYKALFIVRDKTTGDHLSGATVTVDGVSVTTDENGEAYLFCDNGSYSYAAEYAGTTVGKASFNISDAKKTIVINAVSKTDSDGNVSYNSGGKEESTGVKYTTATKPNHKRNPVTTYTFARSADQVISESGQLGDNIYYMRYPSGYVYIYGHGEMKSSGNPFKNPAAITNVVIENDNEAAGSVITNIRGGLFKGCSAMTTIALPNSITSIGSSAFEGCSALEQIIYDKDEPTPVGKLLLPASITEIGSSAFKGCGAFTELVIPKTISAIKDHTFADCSGIKAINIPGNVKEIGAAAFGGCTSAKTITVEAGVEAMADSTFENCTSLVSLTLPYATQNIKNADNTSNEFCITDLFGTEQTEDTYPAVCTHGFTWAVPKSLKTVIITGGTVIPHGTFQGLSSVETIAVPDTVTLIGANAFYNCSSLKKAVIPKSLEKIESGAFFNCSSITEVTIPAQVTEIGADAFSGCSSLKTAVIAGGEKGIGARLFNKCESLESITLPFAGYSLEGVEKEGSSAQLINLFENDCGDTMYESQNASGGTRYVPKSLKTITITGGTRLPNGAFCGFSGVENFVITDDVTSVGSKAFMNCSSVKDIFMNDNITYIGDSAYAGCTGLTDVTIPANVTTIDSNVFSGCTGIKNAVIEGGSKKIGNYLFNKCTSLESLTLPFAGYSLAGVNKENSSSALIELFREESGEDTYLSTNSSGYKFNVPKSLKTIVITGGERIPNGAFYGLKSVDTIVIPDSVTSFGSRAFGKCEALTENVMTDNIKAVGSYAFADCTGIKKAVFGKSLADVGEYAFSGCTGLTEVTVPETVLSLGGYAFNSCTGLKTAEIKGKDTKLGNFLFNKCTSLEKIILPFAGYSLESVNKENSSAYLVNLFNDESGEDTYATKDPSGYTRNVPNALTTMVITGGNRIPNNAFYGLSGLKEVIIPDSVSSIGNYSFKGCAGLEENVMSDNIASVGEHAFEGCTGIKDIYIGESVKNIGDYAFAGCTGIVNAVVPSNVSKVGNYVFSDCSNLKNAVISDGVEEIGDFIFNKCSSLETLTLPFAGNKLTDVNKEGTADSIIDLFRDDAGDSTYKSSAPNGADRYVPKTLRSVTVTGGERLPNNAFANLTEVKDITIPNTVSYIGNGAFSGCESIANMFFPDVKEKWEQVSVDKNNELLEGKVRYLDSEGNYVTPSGTITTTTTTTTKRTTKVTTTTVTTTGTGAPATSATAKTATGTTTTTKPVSSTTTTSATGTVSTTTKPVTTATTTSATGTTSSTTKPVSSTTTTSATGTTSTTTKPVSSTTTTSATGTTSTTTKPVSSTTTTSATGTTSTTTKPVSSTTTTSATGTTSTTTKPVSSTTTTSATGTTSTTTKPVSSTTTTSATGTTSSTTKPVSSTTTTSATGTASTTKPVSSTTTTSATSTTSTTTKPVSSTTTTSATGTTSTTTKPVSSTTTTSATGTTSTTTKPVSSTTTTSATSTTSTTKPVSSTTTTSATSTSTTSTSSTTIPGTTTTTPVGERSLGDISGDGDVNAVDASMVLTYYAIASTTHDMELSAEEFAAADADGNGVVNATDASFILSYYAYAQTNKESAVSMKEYMRS